jgi:thiol-disulfide isomerase/thioredoxin
MKLEQKYFIPFILVCAALTLIVIIYGTINYSQKQQSEFRNTISAIQMDTLSFDRFGENHRLVMEELHGDPVVIEFWATWSGKSLAVNRFLDQYQRENPGLVVVAAVVRDGEEQAAEYIAAHEYDFIYVVGTHFFQSINIPGVPTQILINRDGSLYTSHVGDDTETLRDKLDRLLQDG